VGLTGLQQLIWHEEEARAGAPGLNSRSISLQHAGPTLIARGTPAQKAFHLPKILSGESLWCQGFSEPGAGSDLAAITTRGEVVGDELVVNGQKMWTSHGHVADYQELLVRTDPASTRHKGLTWIICDMHTPGITVRPIVNMMGETHVNTVFYDNVRIPLSNVVGEVGGGWSTAMSTLSIERAFSLLPDQLELVEKHDRVVAAARRMRLADGGLAIDDKEIARKLARVRAEILSLRAMTLGLITRIDRFGDLGSEGSLLKLATTNTYKALCEVTEEVLGWAFLEYGEDRTSNRWTYDWMWSWILTISGGSSEIQREIIADRLLELPRSR
jgi:alkylation response protein AidB-like acyl-CoA dehydrogenase